MAKNYQGTRERTFQQAVIHLLESQYGLLGSRRVLELLGEDLQALVEQFYPAPEHLANGWLVFTGRRAVGGKAHPGQRAGDHELVTLAWPVLLPEDLAWRAEHADTQVVRQAWLKQRLVRLVEYGWNHPAGPVLLSEADLALILGTTQRQISQWLQEARQQTGKPLPTSGLYFDQGVRPTHKHEVVRLYEAGLDEADIARQVAHAPESVGHYLRDYERVKLLMSRGTPVEQISPLIGMQPSVVQAYAKMVAEYHPELSTGMELPSKESSQC